MKESTKEKIIDISVVVVFSLFFLALMNYAIKEAWAHQTETITICHATGSQNNPYVTQHPSKDGDISGHADHSGDIIPPFDDYAGLNWSTSTQAIYNNDCNEVVVVTPPPPPTDGTSTPPITGTSTPPIDSTSTPPIDSTSTPPVVTGGGGSTHHSHGSPTFHSHPVVAGGSSVCTVVGPATVAVYPGVIGDGKIDITWTMPNADFIFIFYGHDINAMNSVDISTNDGIDTLTGLSVGHYWFSLIGLNSCSMSNFSTPVDPQA